MKRFLSFLLLLASLAVLLALPACESDRPDANYSTKVAIDVKDFGTIKLELYPNKAPITVYNFQMLVAQGFYDELTFRRVISGFMIQGGAPNGDGSGGAEHTIKGEFAANGHPNPIAHKRGVISMARSSMPNSASSQFFIMHADAPYLDGQYAAFGRVTEGMEVVDEIADVPTDGRDKPRVAQVMKRVYLA